MDNVDKTLLDFVLVHYMSLYLTLKRHYISGKCYHLYCYFRVLQQQLEPANTEIMYLPECSLCNSHKDLLIYKLSAKHSVREGI